MAQQATWLDVFGPQYAKQTNQMAGKPGLNDIRDFVQKMWQQESGTSNIYKSSNPFATQQMGQERSYTDTSSPEAQRFSLMQNWLQRLNDYDRSGQDPMQQFSLNRFNLGSAIQGPQLPENINAKQALFQSDPGLRNQFMEYWRNKSMMDAMASGQFGMGGQMNPDQAGGWEQYLQGANAQQNPMMQSGIPTAQTPSTGSTGQTASPTNSTASLIGGDLTTPQFSQVGAQSSGPFKNMWMDTNQGTYGGGPFKNMWMQAGPTNSSLINPNRQAANPTGQYYNSIANKKRASRWQDWQANHNSMSPMNYKIPKWQMDPFQRQAMEQQMLPTT
jgi:hypothetical protein